MERIDNIKYFDIYESMNFPGRYMICLDVKLLPEAKTVASYQVLMARLMGLSYPDFCRYCRDALGARLSGKGAHYLSISFQKNEQTINFLNELNRRIGVIKGERK